MGDVPLVLGSVRDGLQFIADLVGEFGLVVAVPQFLIIIHSVDGPALLPEFHEQVGVVVGLLGVEVDIGGPIDLELLIDALVDLLLMQALAVDAHFLSESMLTETGSLTFLTASVLVVIDFCGII